MESSKETILITGITGYIGSAIGKVFLDMGGDRYNYKAAVRNISNPARLDPLRLAYGDNFNKVNFVEADLSNKESLIKAIEGCQYIIHVANPIPSSRQKASIEELVRPAREGMQIIIDAAVHNRVKRIVVTSSTSSIIGTLWKHK